MASQLITLAGKFQASLSYNRPVLASLLSLKNFHPYLNLKLKANLIQLHTPGKFATLRCTTAKEDEKKRFW